MRFASLGMSFDDDAFFSTIDKQTVQKVIWFEYLVYHMLLFCCLHGCETTVKARSSKVVTTVKVRPREMPAARGSMSLSEERIRAALLEDNLDTDLRVEVMICLWVEVFASLCPGDVE